MSDEAVTPGRDVTLNQLIAFLTRVRDEEGRAGVGDLPVTLEDDRGVPVTIRDAWLSWADDAEVETPDHWVVELT